LLAGELSGGNPSYPAPILPLGAPPSDKYDIQEYLRVENKMANDKGSLPYYKEAFFNFVTGGTDQDAAKTKMLHYDEATHQWTPLPTQYATTHDAYGRIVFTSHTPSFSYFAIVTEKSSSSSVWIWVVILVLIAVMIYFGIKYLKRDKKKKK